MTEKAKKPQEKQEEQEALPEAKQETPAETEETEQEEQPQEAKAEKPEPAKEPTEKEPETVKEPAKEPAEKAAEPETPEKPAQTAKPGPEKPEKPKARKASRDDNIVFVGKKPAMSYVMAVVTQFSDGAGNVDVRARGRSISRAVDVVEVVRNRFMQDVKYSVELGTDKITDEQGNRVNVSTININLTK